MESIFFSSLREKFEGFKETKASTEFSATDPKKMISSARASARRLPREAGIRKAPILNYIDSRYRFRTPRQAQKAAGIREKILVAFSGKKKEL